MASFENTDVLSIKTRKQLKHYLQKYNCSSIDELDEVLWFTYGVALDCSTKQ